MQVYRSENHRLASYRRKARMAVQSGRARWVFERPKVVEVNQPSKPPVKHERTPFGQGILRSLPTCRLDCTLEDYEWWAAEEARREEDREVDRMAAVAAAEARYDGWF